MKSTPPAPTNKSPLFLISLICLILWWSALFGLAFKSANPPTLNLRQLKQAQYLVTARIEDPTSGKIQVEREWKKNRDWKELKVSDLPPNAPTGELLLIPISPQNGEEGWEVTRAILPVEFDIQPGFLIPFDGTVMRGQGTVIDPKKSSDEIPAKFGTYLREGQVLKSGLIRVAKFAPPQIYPASEEVITRMKEILDLPGQ